MLIRHGAIYVASNLVTGAFSLATAVVLTKLLTPASYGVYGLAFAIIGLAYALFFDWHAMSFLRFCDNDGKREDAIVTFVCLFAGLMAVAVGVFAALYYGRIAPVHDSVLLMALVGTCAMAWFQFTLRVQMANLHPEHAFWMNLIRVTMTLALSTAAAYYTGSALYVILAGVAAQVAGASIYPLPGFLLKWGGFSRRLAYAAITFGYPLAISTTLATLGVAITRFMLEQMTSIEAVGRFTAANLMVQNVLLLLAAGIGQATYPLALKAFESGDPADLQRQLTHNFALLFGLLLPAAVGLSLVTRDLAPLIVGHDFVDEVVVLTPWMSAAAVLGCMRAQYFDFLFQLGRKTGYLTVILSITTVLNVGLNVLLIPRYGAEGAAIALVLSLVPSLLLAVVLSPQAVRARVPFKVAGQITCACLTMAIAVAAVPRLHGLAGLVAQIFLGTVAYGGALIALDLMGIRRHMRQRIARVGSVVGIRLL